MARSWPIKDPDAILDYTMDWSRWLEGDTIDSATFSLTTAAGLAIGSQSFTDRTATVWLTGGTAGERAEIKCRIVTAAGRQQDHSAPLAIAEQ